MDTFKLLEKQFETLAKLTRSSFTLTCESPGCQNDISDEGYIIIGDKKICNVCVDHLN